MPPITGLPWLGGVAHADVETPEQRSGSADGLSHEASAADTSAEVTESGSSAPAPAEALPHERETVPEGAEPPDPPEPTTEPSPAAARTLASERTSQLPAAPDSEISGFDKDTSEELPEERTEFSRTFTNADGTRATQFSLTPMHFRAADGDWEEIDTSLVTKDSDTWTNAADSSNVDLATHADAASLVHMELGEGRSFGFGLAGAQPAPGEVSENDPSTVTYPEVLPETDLELRTLVGGGVKETIVLSAPPDTAQQATWQFPLDLDGVRPELADDGGVALLDTASGDRVGHIPAGHMTDSDIGPRSGDGAYSEAVDYELLETADGWTLQVSADLDWLTAPERVYPVRVDPTSAKNFDAFQDTYVQDSHSSSHYLDQELKIGTYNGGGTKTATYLKFASMVDELSNHKIYNAELYLFNHWSYSCTPQPVRVYAVNEHWEQRDVASYPGPSYDSTSLATGEFSRGWMPAGASSSSCPARYEGIDLGTRGRDLIQEWVDGDRPNYGLTVRSSETSSHGWKKFGSLQSSNAPYMTVVYSPYRADYAFAQDPPELEPAPLANRATYVDVEVTNRGDTTWTPTNNYELSYQVYDADGNEVSSHDAAVTEMPEDVSTGETVTVRAKINPLEPGEWTVKFDMKHGSKWFSDWGVPRTAQLGFEVPDLPPQVVDYSPRDGARVATLTPEFTAIGRNNDDWPDENVEFYFTLCDSLDEDERTCQESGWQADSLWRFPSGHLEWGEQYYWAVHVRDGQQTTESPWLRLIVEPDQPAITSNLAGGGAAADQGPGDVDPLIGNFSRTITDATVATTGPPLSVTRTFNSQDPRQDGIFGAGWSTRFDMGVRPDADGTGNVVVTYPDGSQHRFARNADGSFTSPTGMHATFAAVEGGGWRLMDKSATSYIFDAQGRLTSVTDHQGRSQQLTYDADGQIETVTGAGGRSLSFGWSGGHVATVTAAPGEAAAAQWDYTYTGDRLTEVCDPEGGCTSYTYTDGSHYRAAAVDANPYGYWRFEETSGDTGANEVPTELGGEPATFVGSPLGAQGVTAGVTTNALDSADGSYAKLPTSTLQRVGTHLTLETWFKTTGHGTVIAMMDGDTGIPDWHVPVVYVGTDGKLRGQFWNGLSEPIASTATVNDGQWHHVALTGAGATQLLYLDGEQVGSVSGQIDHHGMEYLRVGQGFANSTWPSTTDERAAFDFTGQIDEVAIYQRPLDAATIGLHYEAATNPADRLTTITTPEERVQTELDYNEATSRVVDYVDHNGGVWHYSDRVYSGDPPSQDEDRDVTAEVTVTDPRGHDTVSAYDALAGNRLVRTDDQLGHSTTFAYDTGGFLAEVTDPNGAVTTYHNDERGNRVAEQTCRDTDNTVCHTRWYDYFHNPDDPFDPRNDRLVASRDARSAGEDDDTYLTEYTYDEHGNQLTKRLPATSDFPDGRTVERTYTTGTEDAVGGGTVPAGLLATTTDPRGQVTTRAYTAAGDLAMVREPTGLTTEYTYDALGRKRTETVVTGANPDGATTTYTYDGADRLETVTHPEITNEVTGVTHTASVSYTYDADGNRLTRTRSDLTGGDADRVTSWTYNSHGLVATTTDPLGNTEEFHYDETGARTRYIDAAGTEYHTSYTSRGRVAERRLYDWEGAQQTSGVSARVAPPSLTLESNSYDPAGRLASTTDAMGRTTSYTYYADGLPAETIATDALLNDATEPRDVVLESRGYDAAGNLTSLVTGGGATRTEYTYDPASRLVEETLDPGGLNRTTSYTYDGADNPITVTRSDGSGRVEETHNLYDAGGNLIKETVLADRGPDDSDPADDTELVTTYTVDERGLVTEVVDPRGNQDGADPADYTTERRYDVAGRLVEERRPRALVVEHGQPDTSTHPVVTHGYDNAGNRTHTVDANGNTTVTAYDKLDRAVSTTAPSFTGAGGQMLTPVTTTDYDALGRVTSRTDALGNTRSYTYDQLGNVATITDPLLQGEDTPGEWQFTYTLNGERTSVTDPMGARLEATYDDLGRQVTETQVERTPQAAAFTTSYTYDDAGNTTAVTDPTGEQRTSTYNAAGELIAATDALGNTTTFGYDLAGRAVETTTPTGTFTQTRYDLAGRAIETIERDADGTELRSDSTEYDAAGNPTATTSANGHTTTATYDSHNRLTELVEPVDDTTSITTTFGYDAAGNRTRVTDGRGNATHTTYNAIGKVASVIEPATDAPPDAADRTWNTYYDAAGQPVREQAPGGIVRERTYDALGNLVQETATGAEATTDDRTFDYDLASRLATVGSPVGDIEITRDDRGNVVQLLGPERDSLLGAIPTANFTYDAAGRLTEREDATGTATFTYDTAGQLETQTDPLTGQQQTLSYDDEGRPVEVTTDGGAVRTFSYDPLGRLTEDTLTDDSGTTTAATSYDYDPAGQLVEKVTQGTAGAGTQTYGYDRAGRLTSWTATDGTTTNYDYDAAGNRTQVGSRTFTYDERNRLVSASDGQTWTYTPRGTLASHTDGGLTQAPVFDGFNRLTTSGDGASAYDYDALGRIVNRTVIPPGQPSSGDTKQQVFVYGGLDNNPVAVLDGLQDPVSAYSRNPHGALISTQERGQNAALAYVNNHTDLAATYTPAGQVASSTAFSPFGKPQASNGSAQSLGYQGEWTDPTTGDVNMHARWYQPETGRFASRDTMTLEPNPSIQANRYVYANANPLTGTDPSGHLAFTTAVAAAGLFVVGSALILSVSNYYRQHPPSISIPEVEVPSVSLPWTQTADVPKVKTNTRTRTTSVRRDARTTSCNYFTQICRYISRSKPGSGSSGGSGGGGGAGPVRTPGSSRVPTSWRPPARGAAASNSGQKTSAPVKRIDPRKKILEEILNTAVSRPTISNPVSQEEIDEKRRREEEKEKIYKKSLNKFDDIYLEFKSKNVDPFVGQNLNAQQESDIRKRCKGGGVKYGPIVAGKRTGTVGRYCSPEDLKGGSEADKHYNPPGWPHRNDFDSELRSYPFNRGHLAARELGGSGEDRRNLVTLHRSANAPGGMRPLEMKIKNAVKSGQIVVSRTTPIYVEEQDMPAYIHMKATGSEGLDFDVCISNERSSVTYDGSHCKR
ncbi:polymorphic toxin-type HINT domain-containing protein [Salinactinospora qingdaonensis]|uniref:Polymorphic toxin-type HINT domain-containing protein n=1 Tax=Salinactinospora qingdaonensis TaxID=702744 RepID=A0ABP7FLI0_9ACTN